MIPIHLALFFIVLAIMVTAAFTWVVTRSNAQRKEEETADLLHHDQPQLARDILARFQSEIPEATSTLSSEPVPNFCYVLHVVEMRFGEKFLFRMTFDLRNKTSGLHVLMADERYVLRADKPNHDSASYPPQPVVAFAIAESILRQIKTDLANLRAEATPKEIARSQGVGGA